jgi:hypothetical protein
MSQHELKTWRRQRTVVSLSRNFSSRVEKGMDGGCPCKKKTLPSEEVDNTAQHTARCVVAWRGVESSLLLCFVWVGVRAHTASNCFVLLVAASHQRRTRCNRHCASLFLLFFSIWAVAFGVAGLVGPRGLDIVQTKFCFIGENILNIYIYMLSAALHGTN